MGIYKYIFTQDGSVGLYNDEIKDIYHSKTGALKEARDKFIIPSFLPELAGLKNEINILDICYGIGYNTKAALELLQDKEVNIDCLEYDKTTVYLSPFINDKIQNQFIKIFILNEILKTTLNFEEFEQIINNNITNDNLLYFSADIFKLIKKMISCGYETTPLNDKRAFLHNIYYKYISLSEEYAIKGNNYANCHINFHYNDARLSIKGLTKKYDVVFLDAFSPQLDPKLWTIDFLALIKSHLHDNSVLVSYSKSTPFRSALLQLGLNVGKTFIDNIDMGTVASFNKNKILNPLNDYDIGLINTRSGIVYKDEHLNKTANEIITLRKQEQDNSNLISQTKFLKSFANNQ